MSIPTEKSLSFDEFKLYYESAEKVTDRRQELNRWSYSISVAILIAVAVTINWCMQNAGEFQIGIIAGAILCLMAIYFDELWLRQIVAMKKLNNAKFTVLEEMAPRIEFDFGHLGTTESYQPFKREWDILKKNDGVTTLGRGPMSVLAASNHELHLPRAFQILFGILLILLVTLSFRGIHNSVARNAGSTKTPAVTP